MPCHDPHAVLLELAVSNLVIVAKARLTPGEGLCAISGETGAGKSLLMDAIGLLRGARATAGLVGPHGDAAEVTAVIQCAPDVAERVHAVTAVACSDGQAILRRRITAAGRSQAWINDTPVSVAALRAGADILIELHAQNAAVRLADVGEQMALLDEHAGLAAPAAAYAVAHDRCLAAAAEVERLAHGSVGSVKELEWLRFQEREFTTLDPRPGELAELDARHRLLADAERWRDTAAEAGTECERVQATVAKLGRKLADAPDARLQEVAAACVHAAELLREAARTAGVVEDRLRADPRALAEVEARLNAWHDLVRKHAGAAVDGEAAVLAAFAQIRDRITELSTIDERVAVARDAATTAMHERQRCGEILATARRSGFAKLAKAVHGVLAELGMPKAKLSLAESIAEPGPLGSIRQEFHLQANPGLPGGSLATVASGGEAARLVLACAAVSGRGAPVVVFDEVDAGVGARLGQALAAVLARLGVGRSVIAVTHTAHIAARAQHHYRVAKTQHDNATTVQVEALAGAARHDEVAAMLGGGAAALTQAQTLMKPASGAATP